ncbi:MAG TPA: cation-translocating P-type ATPase [Chryseosolibacter sp.]
MQQTEEFRGLAEDEVLRLRKQYGWNRLDLKERHPIVRSLVRALKEPMLLLLILASTIYFLTGAYAEGIFMAAAIVAVSFISLYQESKSEKALKALKAYAQPKAKVIRGGVEAQVATEELVPGDIFIIQEGEIIPADGVVVRANDFTVNESLLTGESLPVNKSEAQNDMVFQGTLVASGLAICKSTATGTRTRMGQIGKSLQQIQEEKSPLQIQIQDFVRKMAIGGLLIFVIIWIINFSKTLSVVDSLLKALTLAMSILPEEIPVAFATFMALGAWRLIQLGIIVKQTRTVETLGSATVICVDKTGTLTKNEMELAMIYDFDSQDLYEKPDFHKAKLVIEIAMWASEPIPFDPMEKALHEAYKSTHPNDERQTSKMVREYPLAGVPPFMTHVFEDKDEKRVIAAKGAPEALIKLCNLTSIQKETIKEAFSRMASQGFRVLAVADVSDQNTELPEKQEQFRFSFKGLVAFYDPPKDNISTVLANFYKAGVAVKVITGDNTITAQTIARAINFKGSEKYTTAEELMTMSPDQIQETVLNVNMFTRMFPEAKLKIIEALKRSGNIVGMTGDGVNDGPALKAAHIGIAMGSKGSDVAKEASALVLSNDDLSGMVEAVAMGRKIYNNLKKAIQYIVSIHIPIILIVFLPLVLGWIYPAVFTPVHVIFLELVMGPTCSIIYENEPIEKNIMNEKPRRFTKTFFSLRELSISILQGLVITAGLCFVYWYALQHDGSLASVTSMVFVTLITANIFLTLTNRSFYYSMLTTLKYKNRLMPIAIGLTVLITFTIFSISPLRTFFGFELITSAQLLVCISTGFISVTWFEIVKWRKRALTRN